MLIPNTVKKWRQKYLEKVDKEFFNSYIHKGKKHNI